MKHTEQIKKALTRRQAQVLIEISMGFRTQAISEKLGISESMVNHHMRDSRLKLGANTMPHAVAIAIRLGHIS